MNAIKTPKRRNAVKTKATILKAAQDSFTAQGYPQTGIRDIAALADVSSTLLLRYYGSKAGLFEAALIDAVQVGELFTIERAKFGETLALLLSDTAIDIKPPSMIALSTGDADARRIATDVTRVYVLEPLAAWLQGANAKARAQQIITLAMGFVLFTRQLPILPAEDDPEHTYTQWFAHSVQAIVDHT